MQHYDSNEPAIFQHEPLFQAEPFEQCPDSHQPSARNWTCCRMCYSLSAQHLAACICVNTLHMAGSYTFAATVNLHLEQSATDARTTWTKTTRKLRQAGLAALWSREVSPATNRLHYHSVIRSEHNVAGLKQVFRTALNHVPHDVHIRRYTGHMWPRYICKSQPFSHKSVLFKPNTGLKKHGAIGKFWAVPLQQIRAELRQRAELHRQATEVLKNSPELHKLAKHIHRMTGEHLTFNKVRYLVAVHHKSPGIQGWVESIQKGHDDRQTQETDPHTQDQIATVAI